MCVCVHVCMCVRVCVCVCVYPVLVQQGQGLAAVLWAVILLLLDVGAPDQTPGGVQGRVLWPADVDHDLVSGEEVKGLTA